MKFATSQSLRIIPQYFGASKYLCQDLEKKGFMKTLRPTFFLAQLRYELFATECQVRFLLDQGILSTPSSQ